MLPGVADVALALGDFREVTSRLVPDESADLVFTDPPYDRKSVHLYEPLAREAARILKPGGSLVAYVGTHALPEVFGLITPYLRYWWLLAVRHQHRYSSLAGKRVYVAYKPLLWFVKGAYRGQEFVFDLCRSRTPNKTHHPWAQSLSEALYFIGKLCPPGGLVVDPFAGSGTTLVAATKLGRRCLGVEIDPQHYAAALERLATEAVSVQAI